MLRRFILFLPIILAVQLSAQTRYGFRIAYENNGIALGSTDQVFNGIKFNAYDNDYYQVRGINIGLFSRSQATRNDRRNIIWGLNTGFVAIKGRTYGLSIYPFGNFQDYVNGFSLGLLNSGYQRTGVSMSLAWTKAVDQGIQGFSTSLGIIKAKSISGVVMAPVVYGLYQDYKHYRMELRGAAASLVIYANYIDGFSLSLVNIANLVHGANIGLVNLAEQMAGLQVGVFNASDTLWMVDQYVDPSNSYKIARKIRPLVQVGMINTSQQSFATQFGLVNHAEDRFCVQFGLININKANRKPFRVVPFVNFYSGNSEAKQEKRELKDRNQEEKEREKEAKKQLKKDQKRQREVEKDIIKMQRKHKY